MIAEEWLQDWARSGPGRAVLRGERYRMKVSVGSRETGR